MSDPDRRLSERLHGIADQSMAVTIGNMAQEMITELKILASPGYPGYISFTLTDAEREAVGRFAGIRSHRPSGARTTLRGLLERMG